MSEASSSSPSVSLPNLLSRRIEAVAGVDPELRPATKPQFGHYQSNVALRLAKTEGKPPREIAARIIAEADLADLVEEPEIAGPGFINLRLRTEVLAGAATALLADSRLGIAGTDDPQRIVIDYSAPNVAKQMHVGHLRSTIIGDCFHRVLLALGHEVVPQNHVGDWGTQFGMLLEQLDEESIAAESLDLAAADALYKRAAAHFKSDDAFADRARKRVVALQSGDPASLAAWKALIEISAAGFNAVYQRLGVLLTDEDLAGESTYNDALAEVVADLEQKGVAVLDDGALCVFVDGYEAPLIIRKRDGGYGYDVTDLAALRHRVRDLHADRLIYVTDVRQHAHFMQVFGAAKEGGYLPDSVRAEHVGYGMVLGTDGRPLKSRDGSAPTLLGLLDEAEQQASPTTAVAAIKYSDLSNQLGKDYVFDPERMVQSQGDTGPYLQYAHARLSQVLRRAEAEGDDLRADVTVLEQPTEQTLALTLSRFGETVGVVAETLQPHRLCGYLHDLAVAVSRFYDECPVLKSEGEVRSSRLALCSLSRDVLARGLDLLGIEAPERM